MSFTYNQFVIDLANLLVVPPTDANYLIAVPNIIDDAEQRIYRELDLLSTIVRDNSTAVTPNNRQFMFPQHFVVCESVNVFTPVTTRASRIPLTPVTREFLDSVYANDVSGLTPSVPAYYAMLTDQIIVLGPSPDAAYYIEIVGTVRPVPLSNANQTTYLTLYLPDLFMAAAMVFGAAYQQNFSAMGDNPQQALSWEQHYQQLKASADVEETRKKYASAAWSPKQPSMTATPPRT